MKKTLNIFWIISAIFLALAALWGVLTGLSDVMAPITVGGISLIIFGVIALFVALYRIFALNESVWSFLGGAALGFGSFALIALISKLILKREALGRGDVWLVGIGGLMLGAFPLLIAILIAALTGSVIELAKIKFGKQDRESEIAFGPYLLLGIGFMAIFGEALLEFYWKVVL